MRKKPYECGIDAAMDVISGKWKVLILWALDTHGRCRFGQLRRLVGDASEKVLVQQLRELERDGIVHRETHQEVPPRVEYSLTEDGRLLSQALEPLGHWGTGHMRRTGTAAPVEESAAPPAPAPAPAPTRVATSVAPARPTRRPPRTRAAVLPRRVRQPGSPAPR